MLKCPQCDQKLTEPNNIGHSEHTCQACRALLQWHLRGSVGGGGRRPLMTRVDPQRCLPSCKHHRPGALVPIAANC